MIEKKFKELVGQFLQGTIGPTEITWITEELQQKRSRRDLFIEQVEDLLEGLSQSDAENERFAPLRRLLLRDLSRVAESDLQRALPRLRQDRETTFPETQGKPPEPVRRRSRLRKPEPVAASSTPEEEGSPWTAPLIGLLLIALVGFMIVYSSLEGDSDSAKEKASAEEETSQKLPSASVIRSANEMAEAEEESAEDPDAPTDSGEGEFSTGTPGFSTDLFPDDGSGERLEALSLPELIGDYEETSIDQEIDGAMTVEELDLGNFVNPEIGFEADEE